MDDFVNKICFTLANCCFDDLLYYYSITTCRVGLPDKDPGQKLSEKKIINYVCSFLTLLLTKSTVNKYVSVVNKQNYVYICIQVFPFQASYWITLERKAKLLACDSLESVNCVFSPHLHASRVSLYLTQSRSFQHWLNKLQRLQNTGGPPSII